MFRLVVAAMAVESSPRSAPLGAASIVAALRAAPALAGKLEARVVECEIGARAEDLAARLEEGGPEAVGFSVYSWNRRALCAAARSLRALRPELLLFAGGPEATAGPRGLLAEGGFDFVVAGEGESASVAAASALLSAGRGALGALASIPGIALAGDFASAESPPRRAPVENPEKLVSPWLSGIIDPARYDEALWELTRGCPYRCAYCYESKGTPGLRPLPLERLEAELELFARSGAERVFVLDPTFDADKARAAKILDLIRDRGRDISWKFEVRAELLDRSLVRRFAAIACSLQIGLQSADPAVLASIGRSLDRDLFRRKIGLLDEAGVTFGLDLIFGLPGESYAGLKRSLDFALELQPNHLDLFPLALLPGTELADRAGEFGIEADPEPPYLVRSTRELPPADLARAADLAGACDLFYSRGRAMSWFLQALRPLKLRPSAFIERFARWLAASGPGAGPGARGEDLPQRRIEALQLGFLEESYRSAGLAKFLPALRDIVVFNGAWGRAVAEGESDDLELSYDPDEVLGPAAMDLGAFVRAAAPRRSRIRVAPAPHGEVGVTRLSGSAARRGAPPGTSSGARHRPPAGPRDGPARGPARGPSGGSERAARPGPPRDPRRGRRPQ
ncbi:MAG TPA: B12-binding domain-containing radical SAM protein [Rectinemataceae bacterium]|nr:B12-binding domain-containing radical SAM protein [Rectinemataceae bacterium]